MEPHGTKRVIGMVLMASGAAMLVLAGLFWGGVIAIAQDMRPYLSGVLGVVGLVDIGMGVKFLQSAGAE